MLTLFPGVQLVADLSRDSILSGGLLGSTQVTFIPGQIQPGTYLADPSTAGSIALLLQISLPCVLLSPVQSSFSLILRGGTNALDAPQLDYATHILLPFLSLCFPPLRDRINVSVIRRGYFPQGGGEVTVSIDGRTLPVPHEDDDDVILRAITLTDRGHILRIRGRAFVDGTLPHSFAENIRDAAITTLVQNNWSDTSSELPEISIQAVKESSAVKALGSGSGIVLWAETFTGCVIGGSAMGRRGKQAGLVGREAAEELTRNLAYGGCVDEYLQVSPNLYIHPKQSS